MKAFLYFPTNYLQWVENSVEVSFLNQLYDRIILFADKGSNNNN